jgi:hypothetical protein
MPLLIQNKSFGASNKPFNNGNKQVVDAELCAAQMRRLAEIEEAYHVMRPIHSGHGSLVASQNLHWKSASRTNNFSCGIRRDKRDPCTSRFHLKQATILGHSFGSATTTKVLRHQDRFQFVCPMRPCWALIAGRLCIGLVTKVNIELLSRGNGSRIVRTIIYQAIVSFKRFYTVSRLFNSYLNLSKTPHSKPSLSFPQIKCPSPPALSPLIQTLLCKTR